MRGLVIYIIAVALSVWVTGYFAKILQLSGTLAEVGILLVLVYLVAMALGSIPWPGPAPRNTP